MKSSAAPQLRSSEAKPLCSICEERPAQRDGRCKVCRCRGGFIRRKYVWTPELDEQLRRLYNERSGKKTEAIRALMRLTGFPRHRIYWRAAELGIVREYKPWTRQELAFLEANAGAISASEIAKTLRRSLTAVHRKLYKLKFSARVREGYSCKDIEQALGVDHRRISEWIEAGYLRTGNNAFAGPHDRIPESQLRSFIERWPEMYSLKRVDEDWFKSLMFPSYGELKIGQKRPRPQRRAA